MVKKFFPVFLVILMLAIIYSYYQKNNSSANKISVDQPSQSVQQPSGSSKTIFLEVSQPINNITVTNAVVSLTGKTIPNGEIFVDDQELKANANGNFSTSVTLDEGQNNIYVVASDDLGNSVEKDITINLESTQ